MEGLATLEQKDPLSEVFTVPEYRIGSAANAREIVGTLKKAEDLRAKRRVKQQGLLDGNPPVPPEKLKSKGRGDEPNINLREAEGALDAAKTPYYDLIFEVPLFAQFCFYYGDDPKRNEEWSRIISEEYHAMLDAWDSFDFNMQLHQWEMCYYGVGPIYWQDARDWRFEALKIGKLLVPDRTKADIDKLEVCAIPHSYMAHELWKFIKNESAAKTAGWNIEAVKKAIANASIKNTSDQSGNWEHYQTALRNGDLYWGLSQSKTINIVHLLSREFSGKITHHILLDEGMASSSTLGAFPAEKFLYEKKERFESFANVICPFFFDIGTGDWHSIKGLGPKIFDFCSLSNLLTMRLIGGAMLGSGVVLKAATALALQETSIIHIGGGATVVSPNYEVQQIRVAENLQGPLTVKRDLKATLDRNTGTYTQRANDEIPYPTLGQEQMNATQQAVLGKGAVNRYYKIADRMYREIARRALNPSLTKSDPGGEEALEFRQRCIERGVPEEGLKFENCRKIKATRNIGNGSVQMRQLTGQALVQMLSTMQEPGRNEALRIWAASLPGGGQQLADMIYPPLREADVPDDQDWAAAMENGVLRQATDAMPPVTPKQDHVLHFGSHLEDVGMHAQQLQQGQGNPMELLVHLEKVGPHSLKHLEAIQGDPTRKSQLERMTKAWLKMSKMADQLRQQIEEAQQAAAKNQPSAAPDPKLIAALAKVHGELGIKREKVMGDMQLKSEKQAADLRRKDVKSAHDIRLENWKASAQPEMAA